MTSDSLPARVDALIVGGGASGLSLACHLVAHGWQHRSVLVVDDGASDPSSRAWASWSTGRGLLDDAATTTFDRLAVRTATRSIQAVLSRYRYRVVDGTWLYDTTDRLLAGAVGYRRVQGRVTALREDTDAVTVSVAPAHGDTHRPATTVRADWVFDSVGIGAPTPRPSAALAVLGLRVTTAADAFDPAVPVLMDFRTDQSTGLAFMYVLPRSRREALVEHTRFVVPLADQGPHLRPRSHPSPGAAVADYLRRTVATAGTSTEIERGLIPLRNPPDGSRAPSRTVPIGAPAGMVKASTGYGYERIQRHSAAVARSLVTCGHPFDVPARPAWYRHLDGVLLETLRREPAAVLDAFVRMFARNPADRVLAFLDEDTSLREELALVRTLRPAPFLRGTTRYTAHAATRARPRCR